MSFARDQEQRYASCLTTSHPSTRSISQQVYPDARAAASLRLRVAAVAEFASTVRVVVQGRGLTITPAIKEVSGGSGGGAQEGGRG